MKDEREAVEGWAPANMNKIYGAKGSTSLLSIRGTQVSTCAHRSMIA